MLASVLAICALAQFGSTATPTGRYTLKVVTSSAKYAGTNSGMYVELIGLSGATGLEHIDTPHHDDLEPGKTDRYTINHYGFSIGPVSCVAFVAMGDDAWLLDYVEVSDRSTKATTKFENKHKTFVSTDKADGGTSKLVICHPIDGKPVTHKGGNYHYLYQMEVTTANVRDAGTNDWIYGQLVGSKGATAMHVLDKSYHNDFEPGLVDKYTISANGGEVGPVQCAIMRTLGSNALLVEKVRVLYQGKWSTFINTHKTWLSTDESPTGDNGKPFLVLCGSQ